jgi:deaminated glutathione amidase
MRLALAQTAPVDDVTHNLREVEDVVGRAAAAGADLVVLPEYAMYSKKAIDSSFAAIAEPLDGSFVSALGALARRGGVAVVAGVVERSGDPHRPHNTIVAIGADGVLAGAYRKIHLFEAYGYSEGSGILAGPDLAPEPIALGGLRLGLMACYDLRFPELARHYAVAGADLLVVASSWVPGPGKAGQWRTLLRARAIENTCWTAGVSQAAPISIGSSLLAGPDGAVHVRLDEAPGLAVADLDPDAVARERERDPNLQLRRLGLPRPVERSLSAG